MKKIDGLYQGSYEFRSDSPEAAVMAVGELTFPRQAPVEDRRGVSYEAHFIDPDPHKLGSHIRQLRGSRSQYTFSVDQAVVSTAERGAAEVMFPNMALIYKDLGYHALYIALFKSPIPRNRAAANIFVVGPTNYHKTIGKYFSELVKESGNYQREIADLIADRTGDRTTQSNVFDFMNGDSPRLRQSTIKKYFSIWDISAAYVGIKRPE